jgi:hypothetical protein
MPVQTSVSDAPSVAFEGLLVGTQHEIVGMKNAHASAEIAWGMGVVFKAGANAEFEATLPALETDKFCGIVVKSDVYDRTYTLADGSTGGELGTTGLKPGAMMNVLRQIWARCEDGCAPGDKLWVRCTVGSPAGTEYLGSLNNADEGTEMIDATAVGTWLTTAAAGGLAILSLDLP